MKYSAFIVTINKLAISSVITVKSPIHRNEHLIGPV